MKKTRKKEPFQVGERLWLETTNMFYRSTDRERTVYEYEVVEQNPSSAYVVAIDRLEKYNEDPKKNSYYKKRIEQRTHNVKANGLGDHYTLWLTKESFEKNVHYNKDLAVARKEATEKVQKMNLSQLKELLNN